MKKSERQRIKRKIYSSECRVPKNRKEGKKKKGLLSAQCKEIEESNRMGKIRDLFNKIRDRGIYVCIYIFNLSSVN